MSSTFGALYACFSATSNQTKDATPERRKTASHVAAVSQKSLKFVVTNEVRIVMNMPAGAIQDFFFSRMARCVSKTKRTLSSVVMIAF